MTMVKRGKAKREVVARKRRTRIKMECSILMTRQQDRPCIMMTWVTDMNVREAAQNF